MKLTVNIYREITPEKEVEKALQVLTTGLKEGLKEPGFSHLGQTPMELSLHLVGDEKMKGLNEKYRKKKNHHGCAILPRPRRPEKDL